MGAAPLSTFLVLSLLLVLLIVFAVFMDTGCPREDAGHPCKGNERCECRRRP